MSHYYGFLFEPAAGRRYGMNPSRAQNGNPHWLSCFFELMNLGILAGGKWLRSVFTCTRPNSQWEWSSGDNGDNLCPLGSLRQI